MQQLACTARPQHCILATVVAQMRGAWLLRSMVVAAWQASSDERCTCVQRTFVCWAWLRQLRSAMQGGASVPSAMQGGASVPSEMQGGASVPSQMQGGASVPSQMQGDSSVFSEMQGGASVLSKRSGARVSLLKCRALPRCHVQSCNRQLSTAFGHCSCATLLMLALGVRAARAGLIKGCCAPYI
jgi:hypothetical protein